MTQFKGTLPDVLDGHWTTPEGREMAQRYINTPRERIAYGDRTDFDIANAIYMADRSGLDLIAYQTSAKDRIRWLSANLAVANAQRAALLEALQAAFAVHGDGYSWAPKARAAISQATGEGK